MSLGQNLRGESKAIILSSVSSCKELRIPNCSIITPSQTQTRSAVNPHKQILVLSSLFPCLSQRDEARCLRSVSTQRDYGKPRAWQRSAEVWTECLFLCHFPTMQMHQSCFDFAACFCSLFRHHLHQ